MKWIDLRSDTVTQPSKGMRDFMMRAEVGDDVYGEDPTVNALEAYVSELSGKESALFTSTATQSNLLAMLSHCQRGDEAIVGSIAHTYWWEGGGAAVLGGVQYQTLPFEDDATLDFAKIEKLLKPIDPHHVKSKLLCLENTHHGKVVPLDYLEKVKPFCKKHNLVSHLDGSRVFNAVAATKTPLKEIAESFDSVTLCFSKGLGAPAGSVLCGSKELIQSARRWRKVVGGGMRQAGILAAGAQYALKHNIKRLSEDHDNAKLLAKELTKAELLQVVEGTLHTNMFWFRVPKNYDKLRDHLKKEGILFPKGANQDGHARLVTHLDVSEKDIKRVVKALKSY